MSPDPVVVFINAARVEVPHGATAMDAVRRWDARAAEQISAGERQLADARGLPTAADGIVYGGAIYRVISARRGASAESTTTER